MLDIAAFTYQPSPLKSKTNFNLESLSSFQVLKKYIKVITQAD